MKEIDATSKTDAKTNKASLQCFLVHKVTPCGLVTSNGDHFHVTARKYNASQIQVFKPLFFM